ncbi:MAG: ABC transporter ATP-binding protein [Lachnospiraceae bacterium]|jgi:ABC-2 type transport system ATP-binding protein|uniref:ABC transporter ATP-binding protein n=1 Tax=Hominisplanchenecus murintestinalis TaxID=2941517 RepID=A0AC61QXA7_9FIRM|nr:ABC transporter ATP-binding protein [Hominisplanchenecus murintestinalis]MCI9517012.1 ABC transporter ATP-binding protein [Lachnospiraceae bacterium]RKJ88668.1 ABC transporter ATP-binding protein [Anaerotruncus sp. 1XD22-93]MCI9661264.1 ABC transporter ATP-binding protein [Lachnospiraceae bacterium]MDE6908777.1 ABC transporter ATP-binding protein [Lachnospiraceae bacterium]NBH98714.1 ABC transporter ATP-binding protein [Lachnospiraceae bacterium]
MIRVKNLTKDYGGRKGIFDLSFEVENGEVFGLLGPEGAGKTTVISQLLGFASASRGRCFINGKSCHTRSAEIMEFTGYLPEEISLPEDMTGLAFVRFMAEIKGIKSIERAQQVAERFELDLDERIRKMSRRTRKKVGIVCAFMHDPAVILLDEPMGGLDALMQGRLNDLILEEKGKGKTILFASHTFEEVERICDRVGMIKKGLMVNVDDIAGIRAAKKKSYIVSFATDEDAQRFAREGFEVISLSGRQITVSLKGEMMPLVKALGSYQVVGLETVAQSLEDVFIHFYGGDTRV